MSKTNPWECIKALASCEVKYSERGGGGETPNRAPLPNAAVIPQRFPLPKPPMTTLPKIPNGDASENAPREVEEKAGGEPTAKAAEARRNDWRDL